MFVVGKHAFDNPVYLAPMSGATDAAFRRQASRHGASAVVTEMIASGELSTGGNDAQRRLFRFGDEGGPFIVQLAGRDEEWMKQAARLCRAAGAEIIDINMGCPARKVTGGLSGAALMRDLEKAKRLIGATVEAAKTPVTLKMRLGWDDNTINAPELACIAETEGVSLLTVHGRTRNQFYDGLADWNKVRDVVDSVGIPVLVNGDIETPQDAASAMIQSGADGVMLGRSAIGRPWVPGRVRRGLVVGEDKELSFVVKLETIAELVADSAVLYGDYLGVRVVRKHISAFIENDTAFVKMNRRLLKYKLCRETDLGQLIKSVLNITTLPEWELETVSC